MFETPLNSRVVSLRLKRREVVDLMMACTAIMQMNGASDKWCDLHDKLGAIVDDFDGKVLFNDGK